MGLFPTRIINLGTNPQQPVANQPVYIRGVLQHWVGIWLPLANAPVNVYVNGNFIGTTTTAGDGSFQVQYVFPSPGQYVISAVYPGSSTDDSCSASASVNVTPSAVSSAIPWLVTGALIAMIIGLGAAVYYELTH